MKNMKKSILVFISAMLCALICLSALSCQKPVDNSSESSPSPSEPEASTPESTPAETPAETPDPNPHHHEFDPKWAIDESEHWHVCLHCAFKSDRAPHDFDLAHVNEQPTADKPGRGIFVCSICNGAFELPIPPLGTETE